MTDATGDDLVELVKRGPEAFNAWRRANPEAAVDLSGASLAGLSLEGAFFSGAKLEGADLSGAALRGAVFSGASLAGASFVGADLRGAVFGPPDLLDAQLATSPLGARLMYGADLEGAVFARARLEGASFRECTLEGVDLKGCDLSTVDLRNASLEGAIVDGGLDEARPTDAGWASLKGQPERVRRSIMQTLILLGIADGQLSPEEQDFLSAVAHEFEFDQATIDALSPRGRIALEAFAVEAPEGDAARQAWLQVLAEFVDIEGTISTDELNVVGHVGEKLGFSSDEVADRLSRVLGINVRPTR
jgi:uncharacterized tellurite resistance protein B-like protein